MKSLSSRHATALPWPSEAVGSNSRFAASPSRLPFEVRCALSRDVSGRPANCEGVLNCAELSLNRNVWRQLSTLTEETIVSRVMT